MIVSDLLLVAGSPPKIVLALVKTARGGMKAGRGKVTVAVPVSDELSVRSLRHPALATGVVAASRALPAARASPRVRSAEKCPQA